MSALSGRSSIIQLQISPEEILKLQQQQIKKKETNHRNYIQRKEKIQKYDELLTRFTQLEESFKQKDAELKEAYKGLAEDAKTIGKLREEIDFLMKVLNQPNQNPVPQTSSDINSR